MSTKKNSPNPKVIENCKNFKLKKEQVLEIYHNLLNEINHGLSKTGNPTSDVKCFNTFVQDLPDGTVSGIFLGLDLGGTNFRTLKINLQGEKDFKIESKIYTIPQEIMVGPGVKLFDHIAECLVDFMKEWSLEKEKLSLGFTFSFPVMQVGLRQGNLVAWTKGFNCEGVVGENVVQLLNDALKKTGINLNVVALLNDTTGTLMSCAFKHKHCKIGLIIGTGCNACYLERVENVELFNEQKNEKPYVIINTEWANFGSTSGKLDFVLTEYDKIIDTQSLNPKKQIFEKMISGMYMGELVRLIIEKCVKDECLFKGKLIGSLSTPDSFLTKHISEIESDKCGSFTNTRKVLKELGLSDITDDDCVNVRYITECVSSRSAQLVACGLSVLINKVQSSNITVGIDGSVYRYHPKYHNLLVCKIKELVIPMKTFNLVLSEDGSGIGAALVASVASQSNT